MITRSLLVVTAVSFAASELHADVLATLIEMAQAKAGNSAPNPGQNPQYQMLEGKYNVLGNSSPPPVNKPPYQMLEGTYNVLGNGGPPPVNKPPYQMLEGTFNIMRDNGPPPGNKPPSPPPNKGWFTPPTNTPRPPSNSWGWGGSSWRPDPNRVPSNQIPRPAKFRVIVVNPAENEGDVRFVVRAQDYRLPAGTEQEINVAARDTIKFDRGTGDAVRYRAEPGTYVFKIGDHGWELYRTTIKVTVDNSDNEFPFHYLTDGNAKRLPAGESVTHESKYPLTIEFDPGNGDDAIAQTLRTGTYRVGLNDTEDGITLYDTDAADGTLVAKVTQLD